MINIFTYDKKYNEQVKIQSKLKFKKSIHNQHNLQNKPTIITRITIHISIPSIEESPHEFSEMNRARIVRIKMPKKEREKNNVIKQNKKI